MKKRNGYIIWPEYFDRSLSRKYGRKVPKNYAIEQPTVEKIENALKALNFEYKTELNVSYPRRWWMRSGRLIVKANNIKKQLLVRRIAKKLKELYKH